MGEYTESCTETVWDGPYAMNCGHYIMNGACIKHGERAKRESLRPDGEERSEGEQGGEDGGGGGGVQARGQHEGGRS
jgi:hypothetical protein